MVRVILASTSPRRREILALLCLPFEVHAPDFEERLSKVKAPESEVMEFSAGKARSIPHEEGSLILASDTLIVSQGEKIGKPRDLEDARRILTKLSGHSHEILTGVVILGPARHQSFEHLERVHVEMLAFSEGEVDEYLKVGESLDKAGAYSIQGLGSRFIAAIRGDYLAAVGLPLKVIANHLAFLGLDLPVAVDALYRERSFRNWKNLKVLEGLPTQS